MRRLASLVIMLLLSVPLVRAQSNNQAPYDNQAPGNQPPNNQAPYGNQPDPSARAGYPNAIAEGTRFLVLLDDKLDTARLERGKHFKARLGDDLVAPDGSLIPRGKKIKGHVSDVQQGLHPRLLLSFDQIETQHGWVPLVATVTGVPGEHGVNQEAGREGEIERPPVDKRRAAEAVAVGAGVGTLAGVAAGGGKGAAIGAAAGAGLGLGAGILLDRDIRLDKGTQLEVQLDRPLLVPR
ncbi:MAG: hypothetical protein WA463_19820 [Terriglobales bacterium]